MRPSTARARQRGGGQGGSFGRCSCCVDVGGRSRGDNRGATTATVCDRSAPESGPKSLPCGRLRPDSWPGLSSGPTRCGPSPLHSTPRSRRIPFLRCNTCNSTARSGPEPQHSSTGAARTRAPTFGRRDQRLCDRHGGRSARRRGNAMCGKQQPNTSGQSVDVRGRKTPRFVNGGQRSV